MVLENNIAQSVWDFEFHLGKTATSRRPDLTLKLKRDKKMLILMIWRALNNII